MSRLPRHSSYRRARFFTVPAFWLLIVPLLGSGAACTMLSLQASPSRYPGEYMSHYAIMHSFDVPARRMSPVFKMTSAQGTTDGANPDDLTWRGEDTRPVEHVTTPPTDRVHPQALTHELHRTAPPTSHSAFAIPGETERRTSFLNGVSYFTSALTSGLVVDSVGPDEAISRPDLCANACFAATYVQRTVPYYSMNVARDVTLRYSSDRLAPRPVVSADVHIDATEARTLTEYWLQVKVNGAFVTFTNGDTKLRFSAPSPQTAEVRLAGQFDASSYETGMDSIQTIVTATYSNSTSDVFQKSGLLMVINDRTSAVGRGWTIADGQRLYIQPDSSVLIVDGSGGGTYFAKCGTNCFTTPEGDFTTLHMVSGPFGSTVYARIYPDSSRVTFWGPDGIGGSPGDGMWLINRLQDTTALVYDDAHRLSNIIEPVPSTASTDKDLLLQYDSTSGLLSAILEPGADGTEGGGRATTITVSPTDSTLTAIEDPDGGITSFAYDSHKRLSAIIDRRGDTTRFVYNTNSWKLDSLVSPSVPIDAGSGSTTMQSPAAAYVPWELVAVPTASTVTTPAIPVLTSAIKATLTDPLGQKTYYTANHWGQPVRITQPSGQVTTIYRPSSTLETSVAYPTGGTDSLSYVTGTPYLSTSTAAGDSLVNYRTGPAGQIDSVWSVGKAVARQFLDPTTGLVDSVRYIGLDSLMTRYTYNSHNQLIQITDPGDHVTKIHYDPIFRNLDSVSVSDAFYTVHKFDRFGRDTATYTSGDSTWTRVVYDSLNRVVKTWHVGVTGDTITRTYDALFQTRLRAPGRSASGEIFKVEHNALGWTTKRYLTADTTAFVSYRYDALGRLTSWTNARNQRVNVTYDSLGRVLTQSGDNTTSLSFGYATDNRIMSATSANAHGTISIDSTFLNLAGRADSVVRRFGGHRYVFHYTYDKTDYGARASVRITDDAGVPFVTETDVSRPDATTRDSVILIGGPGGSTTSASVALYGADGLLRDVKLPWVLAGDTTTKVYHYTSLHAPYHMGFTGVSDLVDSLSRDYLYDAHGRLSEEQERTDWGWYGLKYRYDRLGQFTKLKIDFETGCTVTTDSTYGQQYSCTVTGDTVVDSASYDIARNRIIPGASYSTRGNQLTAWPGYSYSYNDDGNLAIRTHTSSGVADSLFWSATNQLDSLHSGGFRVTYQYNAAGLPVTILHNGTPYRRLLWDGSGTQLAAELDSSGTQLIAQYVYQGGIDQPYALVTDSSGTPIVRYVQQDARSNMIGLFRDTLVEQYTQYTPWGGTTARILNTLADTNRLGWQGLLYEGDSTQLYFARNRWYDPVVGRFISEDPLGTPGGFNLYTFALNDPVNGHDPLGLCGGNTMEIIAAEGDCSSLPDPGRYWDPGYGMGWGGSVYAAGDGSDFNGNNSGSTSDAGPRYVDHFMTGNPPEWGGCPPTIFETFVGMHGTQETWDLSKYGTGYGGLLGTYRGTYTSPINFNIPQGAKGWVVCALGWGQFESRHLPPVW